MNSSKETQDTLGYFSKSQCVFTPLSQHDVKDTTDYTHLYRLIISLFSISLHSWIRLTISCFLPLKMEKGLSLGVPRHLSRI